MLNLVIDFNNILMRGLTTPGTTFYGSDYNNDNDLADIVKKLSIDICYNIRLFSPDRVIIVCDSPNVWRKDILPKDETGYKANRVKDDTKNWDKLWKTIDEFKDILSSKGLIISAVERAEADDLAALWKHKLFHNENQSVIFISSDKDWRQLIEFNKNNNSFCVVFNPTVNSKGRKKLFLTDEIYNYIKNSSDNRSNFDILFNINSSTSYKTNITNALKSDKRIDVECIDPVKILINKIFVGDAGDNVPSFYNFYKTTKRGTHLSGVTEKQCEKLCESLNINNINDLSDAKKYIKDELNKILKVDIPIDVDERLNRQRILVELNVDLFPENIINKFKEKTDEIVNNIAINTQSVKWTDILNGTRFFDKETSFKPQVNSVFNDFGSDFDKYFTKLF